MKQSPLHTLLQTLRRDYEAIPVPEELEGRVAQSIAQAQAPNRRPVPRRRFSRFKVVCSTAAAAMLTLVVLVNSNSAVAHAMERLPVLGAITKVFTFRTFTAEDGLAKAHVDIPQVEGGGALNDAIQAYTDAIIAEYRRDAAVASVDGTESASANYQLDLTYQVVTDTDALFTLRFDKTLIMNNGVQSVQIYTVEKATGALLSLSDLFTDGAAGLEAVTAEIKSQMRQQMAEDDMVAYWLDGDIPGLEFQGVTDETAFYFNDAGLLTVVFNEGDVAPMYMGVVEFTLSGEDVTGLLRADLA